MANPNNPTGLTPVRYLSGAPYNGAFNIYSVPASDGTALGIGDLVLDLGTSTTDSKYGVTKDVKVAALTDVFTGVVIGFIPATRDSTVFRAASTLRYAMVADDPNLLFEVQEGTGGTPIPAADLGLNISFAIGSPSTTTGFSGTTINNATQQTTNTLGAKLISVSTKAGNGIGDSCRWLVRINRHRYVDQLAGV